MFLISVIAQSGIDVTNNVYHNLDINNDDMWLQRKLTIQGRVNVISSLFMSRLWYTLFVTSMPDWAIAEIKSICVNFIIYFPPPIQFVAY
jgi:hypothetical protein